MIHLEFYVFAIPKQVVEFKLPGGIEALKLFVHNQSYQEDEQLATVRFVSIKELYHFISTVEELGLHYDETTNYSEDFAVYSFLGLLWQAEWLQTDLFQLWMKNSR